MNKRNVTRLAAALILAGAGAAASQAQAQTPPAAATAPAARPADVASPHAAVKALYEAISGDAGVARDWGRFRSLFHPHARLIPTGRRADGTAGARVVTPEEYIALSAPAMEKDGFHEVELAWREQSFGNIAHIFTTYATRNKLSDDHPIARGINSVQLFNDGKRWWILNVTWSTESAAQPLPPEYLRGKGK